MNINKALTGSIRHYTWQGRGPIALMMILALSYTSSSQAQETALPVQLASLTAAPTSSPDEAPTTLFAPQTGAETTMPSDLPLQLLSAFDVEMTIGDIILPLSKAAKSIIEELISETIADAIVAVLGEDHIDSLLVDVKLISPVSRKLRERPRKLEETKLRLDVVILIQSLIEDHFIDRYICGAFNENNETAMFIDKLKGSGDAAFAKVDFVSVSPLTDGNVEGRTEDPNSDITNGNHDRSITIILSGVVVVAAVGIGIAAFFFFKRRSSIKGKGIHHGSSDGTRSSPHSISSDVSVEIQVNMDTSCQMSSLGDISTIPEHQAVGTTNIHGRIEEDDASFYDCDTIKTDNETVEHNTTNEPGKIEDFSFAFGDYYGFKKGGNGTIKPKKTTKLFKPNIKPTVPDPILDEHLSSDGEFDFHTSFCGGANSSSMAETNDSKPTTLSSVTDDGTLETQVFCEDESISFEVKVPPGLLGLVLFDSDQGVPAIHVVKDSSPLAGKVHRGDRLVSVDGKDVTLMWATEVSCLVAKKKNQSRRLLFARPLDKQRNVPKMERKTSNPLKRAQSPRLLDTGTDIECDSNKEYVA
jgi:hypothetical protein